VFVDFWGMDRIKILKGFVGRQTEPSSEEKKPAIEPSGSVTHSEVPAPMEPLPTAKEETPAATQTNEQKHFPGME
jgi:hypothetical protein